MAAADGVDARARRVAARLLPTRVRRTVQWPLPPPEPPRVGARRHTGAGHPARAARIGRAIRALEADGWSFLERPHRPGGGSRRIDHLLVGPGGVVVVDSQRWVGRIEVTRGVVRQNGFWREAESADVARTAGSVAALLPPRHRSAVHALICVAQHGLPPHLVSPGVHVVGVTGLARLLASLPARLDPAEVRRLRAQLRQALLEASPEQLTTADVERGSGLVGGWTPTAALPQSQPVAPRSTRPGGRRSRFDWRLLAARLTLAALIVAGAVVLRPEALSGSSPPIPSSAPTQTGSNGLAGGSGSSGSGSSGDGFGGSGDGTDEPAAAVPTAEGLGAVRSPRGTR